MYSYSKTKSFKTWKIGSFYISWQAAGVLSEDPCWTICYKCWMYGPAETLRECVIALFTEWQQDKNLVG